MVSEIEYLESEKDNPVASFEVGVMTGKGEYMGVCLKFRLYDGSDKITHWANPLYAKLVRGLIKYIDHLGDNAFMFRAARDNKIVEALPKRHPYFTLLEEKPSLNEDEIGEATYKTILESVELIGEHTTLIIRARYANGSNEEIYLHEYTALSLYGYLDE